MKKLNLTEATVLALDGKLNEASDIENTESKQQAERLLPVMQKINNMVNSALSEFKVKNKWNENVKIIKYDNGICHVSDIDKQIQIGDYLFSLNISPYYSYLSDKIDPIFKFSGGGHISNSSLEITVKGVEELLELTKIVEQLKAEVIPMLNNLN